jgi:hypothetical protein
MLTFGNKTLWTYEVILSNKFKFHHSCCRQVFCPTSPHSNIRFMKKNLTLLFCKYFVTSSLYLWIHLYTMFSTIKNYVICNWPCNYVFELKWSLSISLQLNIFLWHKCYRTSHMNCNSCKNNYYVCGITMYPHYTKIHPSSLWVSLDFESIWMFLYGEIG